MNALLLQMSEIPKVLKKQMIIVLLATLLAVVLASSGAVAQANSVTVVRPSDVEVTWFENDTRSGGDVNFVSGPAVAPYGTGSLEMTTTDDTVGGSSQAKAQLFTYQHIGVPLADIDGISYWTYRDSSSTNSAAQTISINMEVDYVGDGSSYTTLVWEPIYAYGSSNMSEDTWQLWDTMAPSQTGFAGGWWSTKNIPGVCAFNCFVDWNTIVTNNPDAKIKFGFGFNVGSGWTGEFIGYADGLTLSLAGQSKTYDFEPDTEGPITSDVIANPNPAAIDESVTLTANIDDSTTGGSAIASAEYSINGGTWVSMDAQDSSFDNATEDVEITDLVFSEPEVYEICVRGTDEAGNTGAEECIFLAVYDPDAGFVTGGGWIDSPAGAMAPVPTLVWDQGFELDAEGWFDSDDGWHGTVTRIASGTGGIDSSDGSWHAVMEGNDTSAPFSRFDGYRDTWPGDWTAEIDVYLDPAWAAGTGFDYSVAANGSDGEHQRDYIFHVGVVEDYGPISGKALLVNGSNNADFFTNPFKLVNDNGGDYYVVNTGGWYTLQHEFYDAGGYLAVNLNLLDDAGNVLWTATRSNTADTIPGEVGGNRYAWFTHIDVSGGIAVDEHELVVPLGVTGKANFGFVSKYKKGASVPTGNTEFHFKAGNLNFHSSSYDWLVITGNNTAKFKGEGTINGDVAPNGDPFKFQIWAGDGTGTNGEDTFRIKIWWEDGSVEHVVYDNGMDQDIGGGNIVVHAK